MTHALICTWYTQNLFHFNLHIPAKVTPYVCMCVYQYGVRHLSGVATNSHCICQARAQIKMAIGVQQIRPSNLTRLQTPSSQHIRAVYIRGCCGRQCHNRDIFKLNLQHCNTTKYKRISDSRIQVLARRMQCSGMRRQTGRRGRKGGVAALPLSFW